MHYLVRAVNPKLSDVQIRRAALQIFSLAQGYKLFYGMGPNDAYAFGTAEKDIRELTRTIVFADRDAAVQSAGL